MKMVDMKRPKKKGQDKAEEAMPAFEEEPYPYGLRLNLNNEELEKLPMFKDLNAGDPFQMIIEGTVTRVSTQESTEGRSGKDQSIELQAEKIGLPEKTPRSMKFKTE